MDQGVTNATNLDLDIDLESGGTSDEDASKNQVLSAKNSKNNLDEKMNIFVNLESLYDQKEFGDCRYPYGKFITSDEISAKSEEQMKKIREDMINFVDKTMNKENPKRHSSTKPPRPPRGPSLDPSDLKLLKEISELNMKRKRMERTRTMKKIKKEKTSTMSSNLIAFLVTIIFFLVIIFQGMLGSRV